MKDKVERLARGLFDYETPVILISEEELQITVEAGKTYNGSFTIKNNKNTPVKGVLYSSSKLLELKEESFTGIDNIISYCFKADNMNAGETAKGEICVVSDCGEYKIPFIFNTEVPYFNSSLGKIKDLYNFANLAKSDWAEALKLFKSEEFGQLIKHYETKYDILYRSLLKSSSNSQALEEFLIAIHKKLRINIQADKTLIQYEAGSESFMDKITLTKDNWGYARIQVSTDSPFISLDHKIIWSDNFIGNSYSLEFVIHPDKMRPGNNYGRIFLNTVYQTIIIEVVYKYHKTDRNRNSKQHQINSYRKLLTENYLNFRNSRIPISSYITDSSSLIESISSADGDNQDRYHLMRTHLLTMSGKDRQAELILQEFAGKEKELKCTDVVAYCAYLYLTALLYKNKETIERAQLEIRGYYEGSNHDWELLWFLLFIDKKYEWVKKQKLEDIKEQFRLGCHSPLLYFEAITVWNEEPSLLHELGDFELQVLHFGIKRDFLNKDAAEQFIYLAGKKREFNPLLHRSLVILYEKYKQKDTLSTICSLIIIGHQRNSRYFEWLSKGVEEQLRITELHEYYMYSLPDKPEIILPQPILLYFIYNSNLNDRKKAYLYSYIVKNKESLSGIYRTYYKHILQFTLKQLAAHAISLDLAILYEEIIAQEGLSKEIANELPNIMFQYEITCSNPNMKGAFLIHKEISEEVYTPFVNGSAYVNIFTDNAEILLTDGYDNRYAVTAEYTLNKLLHWEDYVYSCYELHSDHPYLLLNLSDNVRNYQKFDEVSVEIRKSVLQLQGLSKDYYSNNLKDLIYYYYDNFEGELLEYYLGQFDLYGIRKEDRDKIIELFIIRGIYDKALSALNEYGFDGIAVNRLMKLVSNQLQDNDEEKSEILISLSYYIFKAGKYNEDILNYLVKYYFGTTGEMFELWKAATAFEMETVDLEERLLAQMLFAESYISDSISVFLQYYKRGCNHKLIKAFLSYNAFKYLVKDRVIQAELFAIMKREVMYEDNEVCVLALLLKYSQNDLLTDGEIDFIDYHIHKFSQKGIVLPFFIRFQNKVPLPPKLYDKYYVEYKTNPLHHVTIHYRLEGKYQSQDFTSEEMKNAYHGIFVKEFILFYNERIQYYITEEDENGEVTLTESKEIQLSQNMLLDEDTRYNHLNFMLTALDMQDEKTLMDSMCNYSKMDYLVSKLFKPI